MIRILIADDHPMVRHALKDALQTVLPPSLQVDEAGSVAEAQRRLRADEVDLLMLDLHMPGADGALVLHTMRTNFPTVPVLVVSATEDPAVIRQVAGLGAAGFLPKSAPWASIGEAVTTVLRGELWFPRATAREPGDAPGLAEKLAILTPQQHRVFLLVAHGKANKEIANELAVTEATVKAHVSHILDKLGVNSRTQAALMAQGLRAGRMNALVG